ncbi:MAG: glycosyltransferase family 2 protein [Lentisphaerae bacterium]|nr:glycosyltransferase family 2 protein [Lentisphaerota bacterium]
MSNPQPTAESPDTPDVSVVVPVYNEAESVPHLCEAIHRAMSETGRRYEILLIDDGSTDGTWDLMKVAATSYPGFRLIRFRRNFGQTAAIAAGFKESHGRFLVTMDADMQNDPADVPSLLARMEEGHDVVSGWRKERHDPFLTRRLPSMLANGLISKITGVALHDYGCTLKVYRREIVDKLNLYGEMHRFIPALASWVGGSIAEVAVRHNARKYGTSKYGLSRTLRVVLDLITVKFLTRYSVHPIQMFGKVGLAFGVPGMLILLWVVFAHLSHLAFGTELASALIKRPFWLITPFMLIIFCMQFISMGLLAEIQIRTYHESQNKPTYVIREIFEPPTADG